MVLLVSIYDLCYSKEGPENFAQQPPPTPEDLSSEEEQGSPGVGLICMVRPVAAENLGFAASDSARSLLCDLGQLAGASPFHMIWGGISSQS